MIFPEILNTKEAEHGKNVLNPRSGRSFLWFSPGKRKEVFYYQSFTYSGDLLPNMSYKTITTPISCQY